MDYAVKGRTRAIASVVGARRLRGRVNGRRTIASIADAPPDDPDLKRRTKVYQGIVRPINWLATCTRPDIAPALTFLASYNQAPSHQHYKSAIHALKYL